MTSYEADILQQIEPYIERGEVSEVGESHIFFNRLAQCYPVVGSKIQWGLVPGSIELYERNKERHNSEFLRFFLRLISEYSLSGAVIYVGDSLTDFALGADLMIFKIIFPILVDIPQHHYFIGAHYNWCMCFTIEGDMAFGWRPSAPSASTPSPN